MFLLTSSHPVEQFCPAEIHKENGMSCDQNHVISSDQAFEALFAQIDLRCDDIKIESAEASLAGKFSAVRRLGEGYNDLLAYRKKIEKIQRQWLTFFHHASSEALEPCKKEKFKVTLHDETIEHDNNEATFIAALTTIGLEQVALLDKKIGDTPLVQIKSVKDMDPLSDQAWQIHTSMPDTLKYKTLKNIGKKLNIPLSVQWIS